MATIDPLIQQFAASRPDEVADQIASYGAPDAAELIEALPADVAIRVCASMPSRPLSELLEYLEPRTIGAMLRAGSHNDTLTLLAHLHEHAYDGILEATPEQDRARLKRLFSFPEQTLSALASPDFIRVSADTLCEAVAAELMASQSSQDLPIFVVDDEGRYLGLVNTQAVISRRNRTRPVSGFTRDIEALPGDMPVATALSARQWNRAGALAVVDSDRQIIGSLTRETLSRVAADAPEETGTGLETIFSELAARYLDLCANAVSLVFDPESRTGANRDNGHRG